MILTIVVAHDPNMVIGKEGGLPWKYPEDLKHFKETTMGGTMIMGRGVWEELGEKPLPGRTNIVLSGSRTYENVATFKSLEEALESANTEEVFIIGGGILYRQAITMADRMIVTLVRKQHRGDTFFPDYREEIGVIWKEVSRRESDELVFLEYERM
ncbi:MAG: dihydrofolate reductase [Bacteroidota bacterium]